MRRRILSRANDLTGHTCAGCGLPIHGAATVVSDSAGGRTYYHRGYCLPDRDRQCRTGTAREETPTATIATDLAKALEDQS